MEKRVNLLRGKSSALMLVRWRDRRGKMLPLLSEKDCAVLAQISKVTAYVPKTRER